MAPDEREEQKTQLKSKYLSLLSFRVLFLELELCINVMCVFFINFLIAKTLSIKVSVIFFFNSIHTHTHRHRPRQTLIQFMRDLPIELIYLHGEIRPMGLVWIFWAATQKWRKKKVNSFGVHIIVVVDFETF